MMTTQSTNQISSAKPFRLLTNYYFPSLLTQSRLVIVAPPSATHFLYWVSNWLITSEDESPLCLIILIVSMIDSQLANPVEAPCNQSFDTFLFPTKKTSEKARFCVFLQKLGHASSNVMQDVLGKCSSLQGGHISQSSGGVFE